MRPLPRVLSAALTLIVLFICPRLAAGDTFVSGTLSSNTTWTLAQSPIVVTGFVEVPAGVTLTIEPGVVVRFEPSEGLAIYGTLIARGTPQSKIHFTSAHTPVLPGSWSHISFWDNSVDAVYDGNGNWQGGSVLQHAIIEGGGLFNFVGGGMVYIRDARPLLDSLTIRTTRGSGVEAEFFTDSTGTLRIRDSEFTGSWQGGDDPNQSPAAIVLQEYRSSVVVERNVISGWSTGIALVPYTPFSTGAISGTLSEAVVAGNTIFGNVVGVSTFRGRNLILRATDNIVYRNQVGMSLYVWGPATMTVSGNVVRHNTRRGINVSGYTQGWINNLTISRNIIGDNVGDNTSGSHTGDGGGLDVTNHGTTTVTQNVFGSNIESWSTHSGAGAANFRIIDGSLTFSQNLIAGNVAILNSGVRIGVEQASTATVTGNTFTQNVAIEGSPFELLQPTVVKFDTGPDGNGGIAVQNNNIFGNASTLPFNRFALYALGWTTTTNATGNWWGTTDTDLIQSLVRWNQFTAGSGNGIDPSFLLTSINTNAPIAPPSNLVVNRSGGTANVSWNANSEGDVAGYRVWYGQPGRPFYDGTGAAQGASPIDVGNATSFQLTGLPANTVVTVTAYDMQRDGVNDQTDGHESWFATIPPEPVRLLSFTVDRTAPQQASSGAITFTAEATGGKGPLQYSFQIWDGSVWQYGTGWGMSNTFVWSPVVPNANYRVRVWVRDFLSSEVDLPANAQSEATIDFPITPAPLILANISVGPASPQPINTTVIFFTSATGGSTNYQYKWLLSTDGGATYSTVQDWSSFNQQWVWRPTIPIADARITVWMRDSGTADAPMRQSTVSYVVTAPLALTSITPNLAAPQPTGTTITFTATATGGVEPYQYKWFIFDGATWTVTQNWSSSATLAWTPAIASSAYRVGVWIRNAGSTADAYANANSNGSIGYAITAQPGAVTVTGLTSNLASPQMAGAAITFTASATGGTQPLQYKWRLSTNGGTSYSTLQDWSTNPTLVWTPVSPIADARINVWARGSGVTADAPQAQATMPYQITTFVGPLALLGITPELSSPQATGTSILFSASTAGGVGPLQYKWWVYNGSWNVVRDWSTIASFFWTPSAAGTYRVAVWVRNWGNTADMYENANSNGSIEYVVTPAAVPLSITSLTSNPASPQAVGSAITFSAGSTGGTTPHQFKWRVSTDGGNIYTTAQDWSTSASFTWTPGNAIADARISVWARNSGVTADLPQAQATLTYVITTPSSGPLVLNSIVPSVPSPQPSGTAVTFTANASGGTGPYQYKWWIFDGGWQVVRQWSTDNTFIWTPTSPSSAYRVAVWVRNAGSTADAYDNANSNASIGYVVTAGASPLTVTNLTADAASPQVVGTAITFTATGGGGTAPYQFKWRVSVDGGTTFTTAQDWNSNASFIWTPGSAIADARITVWARNSGVTTDAPQGQATLTYVITTPSAGPLVLNSIAPSVPSPQPTGTAVTFTANASGGTGPYQYKWWVFDGGWNVVRNWSTSNTFVWTPTNASSGYRVAVWVRNAGSTADVYDNANSNASIGYVISAGASPLSVTNLTANAASPQVAGAAITFTASAGGGTAPYQFKWRMSIDGGTTFTTVQDWSSSASFTWQTAMPVADARITVWARNNGVTTDAPQGQATIGYVIAVPSAGPLVLNSIVPNLSAPRTAGTSITFTANASGGTGPYQYKWWFFDGSWQVVRQWSTDNTFTWTPTGPSSAYRVGVWVRNAGSSADAYDNANSNGSIAFVIVP